MDRFKKFRTTLHKAATKELNAFEHALKEELARREDEQALEIKGLQDEIHVLRQQVTRTTELEQELQQLKMNATPGNAPPSKGLSSDAKTLRRNTQQPSQNTETTSGDYTHAKSKEVEYYRQIFFQCSLELDRVKEARAILEKKAAYWKKKSQYLSIRLDSEHGRFDYTRDGSRPGSAPVTRSNRCADLPGSNIAGSSINDYDAPPALTCLRDDSIATGGDCMDQDDAETSDESEHLVTAKDWSNGSEFANNKDPSTSHPQIKSSESEEPIFLSDVPVNVPLKRKRNRSPENDLQRPKKIKEETSSSSPVVQHAAPRAAGLQESIDLDEISGAIYTPRKDQGGWQQLYGARSSSPSIQRILDARPPQNIRSDNSGHQVQECDVDLVSSDDDKLKVVEDDVAEVQNDAYYRRLGEEHATRLRDADKWKRAEERRARQRLHNERQFSRHPDTKQAETWELRYQSAAAQKQLGRTHVLQPTDANVILPRTDDVPSSKKRKTNPRSGDHGVRYLQQLAEDGERSLERENKLLDDEPRDKAVISRRSSKDCTTSTTLDTENRQRRLDQLLARPFPDKPRLDTKENNVRFANRHLMSKPRPIFQRQISDAIAPKTPDLSRDVRSNAADSRSSLSTAVRPPIPLNTPDYRSPFAQCSSRRSNKLREPLLRSRPLSHLSLNDFKINPKQNQGYDYAFKEVVRKQDQRKCLPGCTRLDCCGTIFRKMAETVGNQFYHTSRLMGPSQEYDERSMLEDYLGNQAYRLKGMSKEKKAETLLQAKTKILADHYGRHREVYAREPSPVGYWDVDMPNSQEAAEIRRMAEIRTRQKVEERYREALKQDGMWKFRDE
ncbi:MAG: hypothetical protein Q9178_002554 [Gyalolechia marmorata]